jgi:hypothetical protein
MPRAVVVCRRVEADEMTIVPALSRRLLEPVGGKEQHVYGEVRRGGDRHIGAGAINLDRACADRIAIAGNLETRRFGCRRVDGAGREPKTPRMTNATSTILNK